MRTDEKLAEICDQLLRNCGDLHDAARWVGLSPMFVTAWMKDDKVAAEQITEAQRVGWLGLESAALERAVRGVDEDVYYRGAVVGKKTVYSDGLLGKLLEARVPAFKKGEAGNTFNGPTQINIMPRADNYEQWLAMKDSTGQFEASQKIAIEDKTEEAEYVELDPERPLAALADIF